MYDRELSLIRLACDPEYATYTEAEIARRLAAPAGQTVRGGLIPGMVPPTVVALLAADRVARTRGDGRCDLFGVFDALNLRLPTRLTFAVWYAFTACHGAADLDIVFLGPDDAQLGRGPVQIPPAADPLAIVKGAGTFDGVLIDRPGTYRLRIEWRGKCSPSGPS